MFESIGGNRNETDGNERESTVKCFHVETQPRVAGNRRRYCREQITMLGGWGAGIALLPGAGGEVGWQAVGVDEGWSGAPLPVSLTGLLVHYCTKCNQPVSKGRLNQSSHPAATNTTIAQTHSSMMFDQGSSRICCCLLSVLMVRSRVV